MVALVVLASCSKDDDSAPAVAAPAKVPLATKIVSTGVETFTNKTFDISYDAKRRISKIVRSGFDPQTYDITYNNDNSVNKIISPSKTITFYYDTTGHLTGYGDGTTTWTVSYNATTNQYTYNIGSGLVVAYAANGDIDLFNGYHFIHDSTIKGPFTNVGAPISFIGLFIDNAFEFIGYRTPLSKITDTTDADYASFLYAYNANGYAENIVFTSPDTDFTVAITYTTL